jgi:hypothetical protein
MSKKIVAGNFRPPLGKPSLLRRLLDRFFEYESMSGNGACPVYLERWTMFYRWNRGVYLHHFLGDDFAIDPHDHPRRFVSIGLWGWYWEDVYSQAGKLVASIRYRAPWLRTFPAEHVHRVRAQECGNCWTLVIVLPKSRAWGFVRDGLWIPFKEYVFGGKSRKSC